MAKGSFPSSIFPTFFASSKTVSWVSPTMNTKGAHSPVPGQARVGVDANQYVGSLGNYPQGNYKGLFVRDVQLNKLNFRNGCSHV